MFPLIRSGQEITITPIDFEEIQLNSLIAFQRHTHIVVHRVVEINRKNEGFVMTQGDANFHLDEAITIELLVGGVLLNKPQAQRGPFFKFYVKTLVFFMRLGKRILLKLKKSARSFYPKN